MSCFAYSEDLNISGIVLDYNSDIDNEETEYTKHSVRRPESSIFNNSLSSTLNTSDCSLSFNNSLKVTAAEVRDVTPNYQRLLAKARKQIKKLNNEKLDLEKEKEKSLVSNIELAVETKKLLLDRKDAKKEINDLLAVNEEFAMEVKRLDQVEETLLHEKDMLTIDNNKLIKQNEQFKIQEEIWTKQQKLLADLSNKGSEPIEDKDNQIEIAVKEHKENKIEDLKLEINVGIAKFNSIALERDHLSLQLDGLIIYKEKSVIDKNELLKQNAELSRENYNFKIQEDILIQQKNQFNDQIDDLSREVSELREKSKHTNMEVKERENKTDDQQPKLNGKIAKFNFITIESAAESADLSNLFDLKQHSPGRLYPSGFKSQNNQYGPVSNWSSRRC